MLWFFFTTEPCPTAIGGSWPGHVFRPKPGKFTPCGRFRSAIHIECLDKWRETDHHWIFDMAMLQNYCFRPNLDGSISTISSVAIPLILHVGSPHSYNQWQCYIPEIVDCMLYQVVGPPIYAQISPVSHTFVTSECILYIYIDSFLVESFFGCTYMPMAKTWSSFPFPSARLHDVEGTMVVWVGDVEWQALSSYLTRKWINGPTWSSNIRQSFFFGQSFPFWLMARSKTCTTCIQCICDVLFKNDAKTISCFLATLAPTGWRVFLMCSSLS